MIELLVGWVGRVILISLVVRMVFRALSGGTRKAGQATGQTGSRGERGARGVPTEKTVDKLVRDPQCGVYVAEHTSVTASLSGSTLHFCSERCRDEYLASPRATAV